MASFKAFLAAREAGTLGEDDERWYEVDADVVWIVDAPRADARMVDHRLRGERLRGAMRGAYVRTLGAFADAARLRRCGGAFAAPMDELTLAHELRGRLAEHQVVALEILRLLRRHRGGGLSSAVVSQYFLTGTDVT